MMIDNTSISLKQMRTIIKAIYSAPNESEFSLSLHRIHKSSIFIVILYVFIQFKTINADLVHSIHCCRHAKGTKQCVS